MLYLFASNPSLSTRETRAVINLNSSLTVRTVSHIPLGEDNMISRPGLNEANNKIIFTQGSYTLHPTFWEI